MWFDVQQALSEIEGGMPPLSVQSPVAGLGQRPLVAVVASVAVPPVQKQKTTTGPTDLHPHGTAFDRRLITWTGGAVSLEAWRLLTEWEKHGPNGQHWNGITQTWEQPK
jgi:hypothetical protein